MDHSNRRISGRSCKKGLSLIELMTTIVIMGVLTTAAIPLGEVVFIRDKEIELKDALMSTRKAIDTFYADTGRYPTDFSELRWSSWERYKDSQETYKNFGRYGRSYLRRCPPINPFASSNQAWIVILTNCPSKELESHTLESFNTMLPQDRADRQIYDIQFPTASDAYFQHQISIFTSLEGTPYSEW